MAATIDNSKFKEGLKPELIGRYYFLNSSGYWQVTSDHGRSQAETHCAFCDTIVRFYIWSMRGGGKKCGNCGAVIGLFKTRVNPDQFKHPNQFTIN